MILNKKQIIMAFMLTGALALLPACWPFGKKVETQENQDLYVINVLDNNSYEDCRIAGSINVPFEEVETFAKDLDRKAEIVVYCSNYMCSASSSAAQKLKEMGFESVWAYEGGTAEWYQMGKQAEGKYPVEGTCQASYLSSDNRQPTNSEASSVSVIDAETLREKMCAHGLICMTKAEAEEVPQQAAA